MDGLELKEWLNTSESISCHDTRDILDHFLSRNPCTIENGRQVFDCRTDRNFQGPPSSGPDAETLPWSGPLAPL